MAVPRGADPRLTDRVRTVDGGIRPWSRIAAAAMLLWTACDEGPEAVAGVTDSTYVEVMARIAVAENSVAVEGEEALREIRLAVLDSAGLSADQLVAFADSTGRDVERMLALWEAVVARVTALEEEGLGVTDSSTVPEVPEPTPDRRVIRPTDSLPGR